ncbi:MAG TPA: hypothetical protein PK867_12370, partial [Pirellulales bacterium]|nr:hypothetical protein [Pirellulales bacterium]
DQSENAARKAVFRSRRSPPDRAPSDDYAEPWSAEWAQKEAEFRVLLAQARAGSKDALAEAIRVCFPMALILAGSIRRKTHTATESDLAQMCYLELQEAFGGFRGHDKSEFMAWLVDGIDGDVLAAVASPDGD